MLYIPDRFHITMSITVMRSTLDFMALCQFWPQRNEELSPSKWYRVKFGIVIFPTFINVIGSILHLIHVSLPHNSFYHVAEDLITITAQIGVYYYIISFALEQKYAARLYLRLSIFEPFGKPPDFDDHSIKLRYLALFYRNSLNIVVISYFLEPLLTRHACERQNEARNFKDVCGLVSATWMPFNIEDFPNKILFHLWQTYSIFWTYKVSGSFSYLIMASMEHILVRIWHLKKMIKNAIETEDEESRRKQVSKCLEYHIDIFDLANELDKVYKQALFVHVLFSGVLFGIMGFSVLTVGLSIKTMSLFAVWVGAAIFASFSAQRLYDGSIAIGEEVYNSPWYDREYKFQKDLIIIMMRTAQPIRIYAGPFAQLSNVFVLAIFKTAYSYLTLLKASNSK